jgi:hypothetical protein
MIFDLGNIFKEYKVQEFIVFEDICFTKKIANQKLMKLFYVL